MQTYTTQFMVDMPIFTGTFHLGFQELFIKDNCIILFRYYAKKHRINNLGMFTRRSPDENRDVGVQVFP